MCNTRQHSNHNIMSSKQQPNKIQFVDFRWSVESDNKVGQTTSHIYAVNSRHLVLRDGNIMSFANPNMCIYVCRNNKMSFILGVNPFSGPSSISSKIQLKMERIISIIKDTENSYSEEDRTKLRRLLYRSMDCLTELELALLQLMVSKSSKPTL